MLPSAITPYPKFSVFIRFSLFGTLVGGVLGLSYLVFDGGSPTDNNPLYFIPIFLVICVAGFIPSAILAGLLVALKFKLRHRMSYIYLLGLGFFLTLPCCYLLAILKNGNIGESQEFWAFTLAVSLVGSLSSLIVGTLVLPKEKIHANN